MTHLKNWNLKKLLSTSAFLANQTTLKIKSMIKGAKSTTRAVPTRKYKKQNKLIKGQLGIKGFMKTVIPKGDEKEVLGGSNLR